MILNDNPKLYALFRDGVRVSAPVSVDVAFHERSKLSLQEQATVQVLPVTPDGRMLLNE